MTNLRDQVGHGELQQIRDIQRYWKHVKSFAHAINYWAHLKVARFPIEPEKISIELNDPHFCTDLAPRTLPASGPGREERERDFKERIRLKSYAIIGEKLSAGMIPAEEPNVRTWLISFMRGHWDIRSDHWSDNLRYFSWIFGEMMSQWRPEQDAMIITDLLSFVEQESYKRDENNWIADLIRRRLDDGDWHPRAIVGYLETHPDAHEILKRKMLQTLAKKTDPEIMLEVIDIASLKTMLAPRT